MKLSSRGAFLQVSIGKQLKQVLDIDSSIRMGYLVHVSPSHCLPERMQIYNVCQKCRGRPAAVRDPLRQ